MEAQTVEAVGFGERFVAYIVDMVIGIVVSVFIGLIFGGTALQMIVGLAYGIAYYVGFWTTTGATPGKMLMGLQVVGRETGQVIDVGTAILRYIGYIVSVIPLFLGFFWIIWDENNEGWHDKIAGTRVIKRR